MMGDFKNDSISVLILDDQITSRLILARVIKDLNSNTKITEFADPLLALEWTKSNVADLIVADYIMPNMNGVDFIKAVKKNPEYEAVPALIVTVKKDINTRHDALDAGVTDFLTKPIDLHECKARFRNLITLRQLHLYLEDRTRLLEVMVNKATNNILLREKETLMRLARAGEFKDADTSTHLVRMSLYSRFLANAIGLSEEESEVIELAAPLHDLGKIIKENIRTYDIAARLGGDEFIILFPETDKKQAQEAANKIKSGIEKILRKHLSSLTLSIGVVTVTNPTYPIDGIIKIADSLMYSVKNGSKNGIEYKTLD